MRRFFAFTRMSLISVLISLVLYPRAAAQETQGGTVVDGIVATIADVPVLLSDVQMEVDLGLLKTSDGNGGFKGLLESYINRLLILKELEDIEGFRLAEGQAQAYYQEYLVQYDETGLLQGKLDRWGIGGIEVYKRLERSLLASMYTESRLKFYVKVIPSDIEKAYEENPERWGNTGILEAWETIRSELMEESIMREKNRWMASLRQRYDLVMFDLSGIQQ